MLYSGTDGKEAVRLIDRSRLIKEIDPRYRDVLLDRDLDLPTLSLVLNELLPAIAGGKSLAVIFLSIEGVVDLEKIYGFDKFDTILIEVAKVIKSQSGDVIRAEDIITLERVKSNNFILFLAAPRELDRIYPENLERVTSRVVERTGQHLRTSQEVPFEFMKLSIGYAIVATSPLIRPERAVYRAIADAKRMALHRDEEERHRYREEVKKVILSGDVRTVFQPVVALPDLAILGYEALTRGPLQSKFESPVVLFSLADDFDMVEELERVCHASSFFHFRNNVARAAVGGADPAKIKFFLNTDPKVYSDPSFTAERLVGLAAEHGLAPDRIVLEITERSAIASFSEFRERLERFRSRGFHIAIDDTGAGYSSLQAIAELKPDFIKIDMALVRDIDTSRIKQDLLNAMMDFARKNGIPVIAEGVETPDEMRKLVELGVPYAQGFYFARPLPEFLRSEKILII